jgi:molybdopterin/thiamine biosynthesis adenylyltransferase
MDLSDRTTPTESSSSTAWAYEQAFARNAGLFNAAEQQKLRHTRIAIAGMGGVGGVHLITLARLGIGAFTIADPDIFEIANTNRQYGASHPTLGQPKVEVMAEAARAINPELDLRVFHEPIGKDNAQHFLQDADLFVDAIEFFEIDSRRLIHKQAVKNGIYTVKAGPVGFGTVWEVFAPKGMTFDEYFDFSDDMDYAAKIAAFALGVAPSGLQRPYMSLEFVDLQARTGPSSSLACQLAAGVMACETVKILLGRGTVYPVPYYHQFDPFRGRFVRKKLIGGNRNPLQRAKRWWLARYFRQQFATHQVQSNQQSKKQ